MVKSPDTRFYRFSRDSEQWNFGSDGYLLREGATERVLAYLATIKVNGQYLFHGSAVHACIDLVSL